MYKNLNWPMGLTWLGGTIMLVVLFVHFTLVSVKVMKHGSGLLERCRNCLDIQCYLYTVYCASTKMLL